jgi:transposase
MDARVVGIDVSKDRLDVHVVPSGEAFFVGNDAAGVEALAGRLIGLSPALVALEATGGFETLAAAGLSAAGLPVVVVNPAQVRSFADALGKRAKTDPIDAGVIARFAAATGIKPRPLPDEQSRLLADLVTRRRQITAMIGAEEARLRRAVNRQLKKSIGRLLTALRRELESLDADLDKQIRASPAWRIKEDLLASVPGIGKTIARTLIASLPELRLSHRQADRLAGRPRPLHPPVRQMARQELHRRRPKPRARRPLHGRARGGAPQPGAEGLPRPARRTGQAKDRRHHRNSPQAAHHPQRHHPRSKTMANRLTHKTVALPSGRGRPSPAA